MEKSIVTFGEVLLRLSAPGNLRLQQAKTLNAAFGGSEANVATFLAEMGRKVHYISRVPNNSIGQCCVDALRQYNIDCRYMVKGGDRLGSYYMETAAALRNSKVVYDRNDSAFTTLQPEMVDWASAFAQAQWFHWSGIAAAMSASTAECCKVAIEQAKAAGLTISCDINFRKNLWNYGKSYEEVMPPLTAMSDLVFGSEDEWEHILHLPAGYFKGIVDGKYNKELCEEIAHRMKETYPEVKLFSVEMRRIESSNHHINGAFIYDGKQIIYSRIYDIDVIDCVGVGDAYIAALIEGLIYYNKDLTKANEFAMAASALKNTVPGDFNLVSREEVIDVLESNNDIKKYE